MYGVGLKHGVDGMLTMNPLVLGRTSKEYYGKFMIRMIHILENLIKILLATAHATSLRRAVIVKV